MGRNVAIGIQNFNEIIEKNYFYVCQLSDYLYRYYGKKVIILLDEYDTPMQEAYVDGYWEDLVEVCLILPLRLIHGWSGPL